MNRAKLLTATAVLLVLIASGIVISHVDTKSNQKAATQVTVKPSLPTKEELLALVNRERAKNGVAALKEDPRLDQSAQMKADDEVKYNYFGHISPAASPYAGKHGYELINSVGINCVIDGENITENKTTNTAHQAVFSWISSPPHHKAMIDPRYNVTGLGIDGGQIVEHFCQTN